MARHIHAVPGFPEQDELPARRVRDLHNQLAARSQEACGGLNVDLRIVEVLQGGPVDLAASTIKAGHVIEAIDGNRIEAAMDFYRLLNRKAGKFTLLAVHDPASNKRWEEIVKPVDGTEENELLYKRWVRRRRADVEKLSDGKIGYVHVRSNNDASMRVVFEEALGLNLKKDALVVDTPDHRLTRETVQAVVDTEPDVSDVAAVVCTSGTTNAGIIAVMLR